MEENSSLKWISLILLTLQNTSLVLLMRYTRTRSGDMFASSTAVVCAEIIKLFASFLFLLYAFKFNLQKFLNDIKENIIKDPKDWLLIAVPAVIYVIQNNLLFFAVSNLDAATFQICYQLKLLTTALFFRIILKKLQSSIQWASLFLLFIGIVLVQFESIKSKSTDVSNTKTTKDSPPIQYPFLGFLAIIAGSFLSGFAGIFFEKILKGTPKNVWVRNIQLATYGVIFGLLTVFVNDNKLVMEKGFFHGYNGLVWIVILCQSMGGLLVAVVIKYANNILKGFATTMSIILAALISVPLFNFTPGHLFLIGAPMVIVAPMIYNSYPYQEIRVLPTTINQYDK